MYDEVESLLERVKNTDHEKRIEDGPALRKAVTDILNQYTGDVQNATLRLRGAKFREQLAFKHS